MKNKQKRLVYKKLLSIIIFFAVVIFGGYQVITNPDMLDDIKNNIYNQNEVENTQSDNLINLDTSENIKIHYIDVGQGDSILIQCGEHNMLIDAGTNSSEEDLISYLDNLNIQKFDYLVGTHTHEDHIGGMDKIVKKYDFDSILFPKTTSNTKTFENFVTEVKNKNKKLTAPDTTKTYILGDATFEILSPLKDEYEDQNNYSIVIKLKYKDTSFLFTGDAEKLVEEDILDTNKDISADVIKIGHHGSSTSTSEEFLKKVNPKYAVISLGKDNSYGHPHKETIELLENYNIKTYRTDELGTIICTSDGKNISFNR